MGLEFPVNSRIASLFSRQIAIGNAGSILALESMGAKCFSLPFCIYWSNIQTVRENKFCVGPIMSDRAIMFSLLCHRRQCNLGPAFLSGLPN